MSQVTPVLPTTTSPSERLGQAVTVATVIAFIAQILGSSTRGTAVVFVLTLVVSYFTGKSLARRPQIKERLHHLPVAPSSLIAMILFAVLAGALIRQHWINSRTVDIGAISDTFQWHVRFCRKRESCIAKTLEGLPEAVPSKSETAPERLFADQALGEIVRESTDSMKLLDRMYGIYEDQFLGTGQSLPGLEKEDLTDFTSQRIPEYLVPNYTDHHADVLAWRMKNYSDRLNMNLQRLLQSQPINHQESIQGTRADIIENKTNEEHPSLVRFAMIPDSARIGDNSPDAKGHYSGCFGLPERHLVFFSNLDYMIRNTSSVDQAAALSGYRFSQTATNQHLYVFMFVPSAAGDWVKPTWTNLLLNVKKQLSTRSACQQSH